MDISKNQWRSTGCKYDESKHDTSENIQSIVEECTLETKLKLLGPQWVEVVSEWALHFIFLMKHFLKGKVLWEGHKILQDLHFKFGVYYMQTNLWLRFCKILWLSQNIWTLIKCGIVLISEPIIRILWKRSWIKIRINEECSIRKNFIPLWKPISWFSSNNILCFRWIYDNTILPRHKVLRLELSMPYL